MRKEYTWQSSAWVLTNEVRYVYDGMLVVQERDANNLALVSYTRGNDLSGTMQGAGGIGGLLARTDNGQLIAGNPSARAYYHADGNGNITALVNTNGSVVARYNYDPYGNLLGMSGPLAEANTYRFSSKEYQVNAGLYDYGFRCYEPNLQRWLNRDPIQEEGGINLYWFVENDPASLVDPFGLSCYPADFVGPLQPDDWRINEGGPYLFSPDLINSINDFLDKWVYPPPDAIVGMPPAPRIGPGRPFTRGQKAQILRENMQKNGGKLRSDFSGKKLVKPEQDKLGVTSPSNQAQVDHIKPRSKGGDNGLNNSQVLSRQENLSKSDKMTTSPPPLPTCEK